MKNVIEQGNWKTCCNTSFGTSGFEWYCTRFLIELNDFNLTSAFFAASKHISNHNHLGDRYLEVVFYGSKSKYISYCSWPERCLIKRFDVSVWNNIPKLVAFECANMNYLLHSHSHFIQNYVPSKVYHWQQWKSSYALNTLIKLC